MRVIRTVSAIGVAAALAAGCGGGEEAIVVRGDFAEGAAPPALVRAMEAGREAQVRDGAFELGGLVASPVSLRLVQDGDTVGMIDLPDLPSGAQVTLKGLRIDPASRRAFPSSVEVDGAEVVTVNGIRMGGRIPGDVDLAGSVLAISDEADALLFRPSDAGIPDLRVFVTTGTATVTGSGAPASAEDLTPGDSLRLEGRTDLGIVIATRLTLPDDFASAAPGGGDTSFAAAASGGGSGEDGGGGSGSDGGSGSSPSGGGGAVRVISRPAPVVRVPSGGGNRGVGRGGDDPRRGERGRGKGNDKPKERGNGKGRG